MKKVDVSIEVEGDNNFSPTSIEDALNFYFGNAASFVVKAVEHGVQLTAFGVYWLGVFSGAVLVVVLYLAVIGGN